MLWRESFVTRGALLEWFVHVGAKILTVSGTVVRESEAHAVSELLARAEVGPAGLVVEGEAGIGKTTLLLDAADQAADRGFRVLSARGSPTEVTYAYAAVADLLSGVDDAALASLPHLQRIALDRARSGEALSAAPATDERVVANAFSSVIECVSAQTAVLLVIDDAQWLDASSRAVIGFTARRLTGRTGILLSVRTGEPDSADEHSWLSFRRPETITRIRMRPLTLGGVHALIAARLGRTMSRPTITRIHEISGGNPFFAIELAASALDDGTATIVGLPEGLAAVVRRRIGHADDDVTAVLLAAACAAAPTVDLVGRAIDVPADRAVELLESVESLGLVKLDGNRVRFTHPLFATGVYANAPASRRRGMHRALAAVVDQPEIKARHLALAATTGDSATLSALDAAVVATVAQGAPAVAAELIELALKLGGANAERRIRAGELHFRAGSLLPARAHLQSALEEVPSGVLRSLALMWLGAVKAYDDDTAGALAAMSEAADEAADVPALRLLCLLRLALALVMTDRLEEAIERAAVAVELADQLGVPGLRSQALSISVAGRFVWGLGVDRTALDTALQLEDPHGGATTWFQARAVQAMISAYTGDLDLADTQMRALQQRMHDTGTEVDIIWAAVHLAAIAVWSGRYAEASEAAREAVQRAEQMGGRLALVTAWTAQAAAAGYAGREAEARAAATSAIDTAHEIGALQLAKEPTMGLGFIEVSLGNYAAALAVLSPLLDAFDPVHGTEIEGGAHLPDAIEALTSLGRVDDAEPLVDALERNGAARDRPWMLAVGARGRGHVLAARGDMEAAQRSVEDAMVHHERLPMPFERARTQLLLGQLQRRRRHTSAAMVTLREALDTFERIGTPLWAARARAEIGRLDNPRGAGEALTAAERRVAELAAAGLSNKEIAAELFIAAKTVEMNLSRVYRKLDIRSRAALSTALRLNVQGNP
jgi:DNA-binding CsgD family transcriptional regulator/Arc/MetJ-type ribon-helix-helix transcriptional regulator